MQAKVVLGDKQLLWNCPQQSKLLSLKHFISSRLNLPVNDFMISWKDEEGDSITILKEEDVEMALNVAIEENRNEIKFYVMTKLATIISSSYPIYPTYPTYPQQQTVQRGESATTSQPKAVEYTPVFEENNNKELLSLVTSLLNNVLSSETTLSSLITKEKLGDKKYFILSFQAIQCVFAKIMIHKLGHDVIKSLFVHCNHKQKLVLMSDLSHNIVQIACNKYGYLSIIAIMDILSTMGNIILIKHTMYALISNIKTLGTVEYGVRLLKAYFDKGLQGKAEIMNYLAFAIIKHTDIFIKNQYGWFIFYHLLRGEDVPITITDQIKEKIHGKYHEYCKHEFAAKVVEQCLRHSLKHAKRELKDWATIIVQEILTKPDDLVSDKYGKHVFHLALLSKVNGTNGDNLCALKDAANTIYLKHIKRIRMESSFCEKKNESQQDVNELSDELSDEEEEIYTSNFHSSYQNEMKNETKNEILKYVEYPVFS